MPTEPDWFWSLSGGIDSTAAFLLTHDALTENYQKRPVAIYLDTRIGIPLQLLFVQELCDRFDVQLWTLRTHENFAERVAERGNPGSGIHGQVKNELKGRQLDKLNTVAGDPWHVLGLRAGENLERAKMAKVEEKRRHTEVRPVHRLTKPECARIILDHPECPINPLWLRPHFGDCGCGANGDPTELIDVEASFPWFAQRLREIEGSATTNDETETWGWGGLNASEQQTIAAVNDDGQVTLCGPSCGKRALDAEIIDAFRARVDPDRGLGTAQRLLSDGSGS